MLINNTIEKENTLIELYAQLEHGFYLAGVSAIEDKLQEGVPDTIEILIKSGIRLWVLTGDKKETALVIGRTCRLIEEIGRNDIDITFSGLDIDDINNSKDILDAKFDELIDKYHISHITKMTDVFNINFKEKYYMIVDGIMLIEILKSPSLSEKFFKIGLVCRSVICCRVSPSQKAEVVKLSQKFGPWITLSIGDGANDVPMIMEAHIGVGIQGKEGTQAVRSSDYAISQFKYLQRLVLIHGRNGYRRISTFICYYFYKNIILVFTEIYFVFVSGYSGQIFFPDILSNLYNSLWTSWPCIFAFSVEKDIIFDKPENRDYNLQRNNLIGKHFELIPILYEAGPKQIYFNMKVFWKWMLYAIIHGWLCNFCVTFGMKNISPFENGILVDHWWVTTTIFTLVVHVVTYKIFIEVTFWNYLVLIAAIGSVVFYYFSLIIIQLPWIAEIVQPELIQKAASIFGTSSFWILAVNVPLLCILPDMCFKFVGMLSKPTPVDLFTMNMITNTSDAKKKRKELNIAKKFSTILNPKAVFAFYMKRKSLVGKEGKKPFKLTEE